MIPRYEIMAVLVAILAAIAGAAPPCRNLIGASALGHADHRLGHVSSV
jgi:hypothetical protein